MNRLTPEQRFQIVEIYFQKQCSIKNVYRALREFYGAHNRPSETTVKNVITKFRSTFTLLDAKPPKRMKRVRTEENIAVVEASVEENGNLSIRRRAQEVGLCPSTLWKILRKDLGLVPYKIQLVQELKPNDHHMRREFSNWSLNQLDEDPLFYRKILFSDEAHFWLNGYVNKQNCRIWSKDNPHAVQELPMHPDKCTVWCGLWAGGIIGPYFFNNEEGRRVTVNGNRYRIMINEFLVPKLQDMDVNEMWFQQDGATCHTAGETIDLLKEHFNDNIISRNGPVNWPSRSCDLTPLDYFFEVIALREKTSND